VNEPIVVNNMLTEYLVPLVDPCSIAGTVFHQALMENYRTQPYQDSTPVPKFDSVAVFLRKYPQARKEDLQIDKITCELEDLTISLDLTGLGEVLSSIQ
jgi:hypothetical protein